jgi:hypothetical protein
MCRKMGVLVTLVSSFKAADLGIEHEPINLIFRYVISYYKNPQI